MRFLLFAAFTSFVLGRTRGSLRTHGESPMSDLEDDDDDDDESFVDVLNNGRIYEDDEDPLEGLDELEEPNEISTERRLPTAALSAAIPRYEEFKRDVAAQRPIMQLVPFDDESAE